MESFLTIVVTQCTCCFPAAMPLLFPRIFPKDKLRSSMERSVRRPGIRHHASRPHGHRAKEAQTILAERTFLLGIVERFRIMPCQHARTADSVIPSPHT